MNSLAVKRRTGIERERDSFYRRASDTFRRLFRLEGRRVRQAVSDAPDEVLASFRVTETVDRMRGEWRQVLRSLYRGVIDQFGGRTYEDLTGDRRGFEPDTLAAMDWIERHAADRSTLLTDTSKREAKKVLRDGLRDGKSIDEMARELERFYNERSEPRARRLAVTEVVAASNRGALEGAKQGGAKTKTWQDVDDNRVRDEHVEADGQTVALDKLFNVDGFAMDHPGDWSYGAPGRLIIQCRCYMTFS